MKGRTGDEDQRCCCFGRRCDDDPPCDGTAIAQTKTTLRIGHVTTLQAIAGQGSSKLKEVAEKLSNGEIEVQIFPNSQLGGELEMVSQVRLGSLDMAMAGSGIVANIEPTFSITELPFIWKSREQAWQVLNGPIGAKMFALAGAEGHQGRSPGACGTCAAS